MFPTITDDFPTFKAAVIAILPAAGVPTTGAAVS